MHTVIRLVIHAVAQSVEARRQICDAIRLGTEILNLLRSKLAPKVDAIEFGRARCYVFSLS